MEILKLLENSDNIDSYTILDFRKWKDGFYYKLKISFKNSSQLYVKEYIDKTIKNYSYHWQDQKGKLIIRWDNSLHHQYLKTHPHHKHIGNKAYESYEISLEDVLAIIERTFGSG